MYDQFEALIFDMDGTLVDSGKLHEHAWVHALNAYDIPFEFSFMRSLAGVPTDKTIEILIEKYKVKPRASVREITHFKEAYVQQHFREFIKPTNLFEIVKQYHGKKPMAIGTGAQTEEAITMLSLCGIDQYIKTIVGADQVKNAKPAPDTFLRCAELLNADPKKCVVFEDSQLGLQAAASAGMAGVDVLVTHNVVNDYFL